MADSNVSICNLALQKLGASRIVALSDASVNAREVNACFETLRNIEMSRHKWNFAKKRITLAPSATTPDFTYTYAFVLPADCLIVIKPASLGLDWSIENHAGDVAILTNDGDTLELRYIALITDPTKYHPLFIEMLACKIAWHCAEKLTQSNSKKMAVMEEYKLARAAAKKANAFDLSSQPQPIDEWLAARSVGQLMNTEWNEE
jgi:hypothetical protein